MISSQPEDMIEVRQALQPASDTVHRPFLIASLLLATLVGFVLGLHVPLGRLLDAGSPERTADLIQAHGQVQLLGFAGLFVIGMSLRLMPRFASSRIAFTPLVPVMLYLFVGGLLTRAVLMPWFNGDLHSVLLIASVFAVLFGSACFLLVVAGTLSIEARRFDGSSLAFLLGAFTLFGVSAVNAAAAIDTVLMGERSLSYLVDNAIVHLEFFGFLLAFILGVALRAIPTMLGIERPGRSATWLALLLGSSAFALAGALLYIEYVAFSSLASFAASLAFAGLGIVLVSLVWMTGVVRQAANRIRPSSQVSLWLIRSAVLWMLLAGLACVYFGASATVAAELPTQTEFDAVRHILGIGVVTILITGMALMILPEVAFERQGSNRQKQVSVVLLVLLNLAAVLRVLPSLTAGNRSFDERNLSFAFAGTFAEIALIVFTVYLFRLMWRQRAQR